MITVITGLAGSGKTWLMTRLILKEYRAGTDVYINFPVYFPNNNDRVFRWNSLAETYNIKNGIIAIDEGQKLFNARLWNILPMSFSEKISQHRHHFVDIMTTTQDLGMIDINMRRNIHELYDCKSVFRFPKNYKVQPIFQMIRVVKKQRNMDMNNITWEKTASKIHFISKMWTKELYNTYGNLDLPNFLCHIKREKGKWKGAIYSREIYNSKSKASW
jgi:hypothetical protein